MDIAEVKQLSLLRPEAAKRVITNVHMTEVELDRFKNLARKAGVNFSGFVRAALRTIESEIVPTGKSEREEKS